MINTKKYHVIGLMSGTSLDGVDLAYVEFEKNKKWTYNIGPNITMPYPKKWLRKLQSLHTQNKIIIKQTDVEYGTYLGSLINSFILDNKLNVDFIASHGHTIFHQPNKGYTLQIGHGQSIANKCKQTVICDFRSLDVSLGGQGAPLVPIGDQLLFGNYTNCLNLGGFSNISYEKEGVRKSYDICPVNIVLNKLAQKLGYNYDQDGEIARSGEIIHSLLRQLNALEYYQKKEPKSLGQEWVYNYINPLLQKHQNIHDISHTFTEHTALQIGKKLKKGISLITGGGVFNTYLMERIKYYANSELYIPHKELINYKEALIFAFLGILRFRNERNCLSSVTGAKRDCSGGVIFTP